jgi:hypothetical protein
MAEDVTEARLVDMVDGREDDPPTFTELCEIISSTWILLVRKHFSDNGRWPEISVIARPPVIIKYKEF